MKTFVIQGCALFIARVTDTKNTPINVKAILRADTTKCHLRICYNVHRVSFGFLLSVHRHDPALL